MTHLPHWLLVPAGLCLATAVVRHGQDSAPAAPAAPGRAAATPVAGGLPAPAPGAAVLRLSFPAAWAGQQIDLTVHRLCAAGGAATETEWLSLSPRVRADGSLPIQGLPEGSYRLEAVAADGSPRLRATVEVGFAREPGVVHLVEAALR